MKMRRKSKRRLKGSKNSIGSNEQTCVRFFLAPREIERNKNEAEKGLKAFTKGSENYVREFQVN